MCVCVCDIMEYHSFIFDVNYKIIKLVCLH